MNNEIKTRNLTDRELEIYKRMATLSKTLLVEFESTSNSQKYNEIKNFYLDLSFRVLNLAARGIEIRTDYIDNINIQINRNLDLYENYKINWLDRNDNTALEQIRNEMNSSQVKEEAAQVNARKNRWKK